MIKKADKKFEKLGFKKTEENDCLVQYERFNRTHNYMQYVVIVHKTQGHACALIQSYDPALFDEKKIGNTSVGLTVAEIEVCLRKVKELGW